MRTRKTSYNVLMACFCVMMLIASCSKETPAPTALNSFTGEADGTAFTAQVLAAVKSEDLFSVTGSINTDAVFQLYFRGTDLMEYPIATGGPFVETINIINELADSIIAQATNPNFDSDSALSGLTDFFTAKIDSITMDSTRAILEPNEAFLFYNIENTFYFSKSGSVSLTRYDSELKRIDGNFDVVLRNLPNGQKSFSGNFEDIEFLTTE